MATAGLSEVETILTEHWLEIAGGRLLPSKTDLRPEQIASALTNIFLYEFHGREHIEFRLAGSFLREVHGRELTGTNYMEMMAEPHRSRASRRLFGMMDQPCGIRVINLASFENGRTGEFSSYGLPLAGPDGSARFSIHVTGFLSGGSLPYHSRFTGMTAIEAEYIDIGAGIPDFDPPF